MLRELRPHQVKAMDSLRDSLRAGKKRPVLMAPTGYGKTVLAGGILTSALAKRKRVCFVVPAISLVDQSVASFLRDGIEDIGVIQSDHIMTDWSKPVQVISIQTLGRKKAYPEADLVLVDECHKIFKAQTDWMAHPDWLNVPFIGLSATPWTKGLGKYYDDLIISATTQELIDGGYLAPFRVFAADHPDMTGVRTVAGDYREDDLSKAMDKPKLIANIVETWLLRGEGQPTLCFAVDCAHAKHLQRQFEESGVPCGYIDAHTELPEREAIRAKLALGELQVVCNVGTLTTGIDWDIRCIILARPTKSEMLFVQIIGRGARTADGKADFIVLDHSDTHARLGFVTDIHHDTLDDGKPKVAAKIEKKERLPKECPKCHYLRPVSVRSCPACGHIAELPPPPETARGELAELRAKRKAGIGKAGYFQLGLIAIAYDDFHDQLAGYAATRGYADGWVAHKYKEALGVWPRRTAFPADPCAEVRSWIKSRQIAWAKRPGARSHVA